MTRTAEELGRMHRWHAHAQMAEHQLLAEDYWDWHAGSGAKPTGAMGARWVIGRPRESHGLTEIVAGIFGSLVVHGDYELVRFAHAGMKDSARQRLVWMGRHPSADGYVCEKAAIGSRAGGKMDPAAYDRDVAVLDLRERVAEELEIENPNARFVQVLRDAEAHTDDEYTLRSFLCDHDEGWDLWEADFGRIVPPRIVYAHAAIQRCLWLLEAAERRAA